MLQFNRQGKVKDCWVIAAITTLAIQAPQYIKNMFVENESNREDGKYLVRLFIDEKPKIFVLDEYFPCLAENVCNVFIFVFVE